MVITQIFRVATDALVFPEGKNFHICLAGFLGKAQAGAAFAENLGDWSGIFYFNCNRRFDCVGKRNSEKLLPSLPKAGIGRASCAVFARFAAAHAAFKFYKFESHTVRDSFQMPQSVKRNPGSGSIMFHKPGSGKIQADKRMIFI